jgi:hypothetical protein
MTPHPRRNPSILQIMYQSLRQMSSENGSGHIGRKNDGALAVFGLQHRTAGGHLPASIKNRLFAHAPRTAFSSG